MGLDNKDKKAEKFSPKNATDKNALKNAKNKQPIDWLGLSVVISAVIIGGFLMLGAINAFNFENEAQENKDRVLSEYKLNMADPDNTPEAVYEQARQALLNNDLEGILDTIHPDYLWKYEDGLREAAEEGILHEAAERTTPLMEKTYDKNDVVIYEIEPIPGNDSNNSLDKYSERVEFRLNSKGLWKISSI